MSPRFDRVFGFRPFGAIPGAAQSLLRDLPIVAAGLALFYGLISLARYWTGAVNAQSGDPSQSGGAAALRYVLAGAARRWDISSAGRHTGLCVVCRAQSQAERIMIPLLDTLQSIPVFSFLPGVMLSMVALFPTRQLARARLHSADLHRPGLEHDVQRLFVHEEYSARDARGREDLPLELVADASSKWSCRTPP